MKFIAFGDSVTEGKQADGTFSTSWGELVAQRTGRSVIVAARGGERAQDALPRFLSALDEHRPDAVLLMDGYNDVGEGQVTAGVEALRLLVRAAKQRGLSVYLATLVPIEESGSRGWGAPFVPAFNDGIRAVAREESVRLVDVTEGWRPEFQGADGLHPLPVGQDHIAAGFARELSR